MTVTVIPKTLFPLSGAHLARALSVFTAALLFVPVTLQVSPVPGRAAAVKEAVLDTKIASATIYWGLAHVTRSGRIEVKPGPYSIVCNDLPMGFTESSLQVSGAGTARASILGVDIIERPGEVTETPRYTELKERLEHLTAQKDSIDILLASLGKRQEFIGNLGSYPFRERKEEDKLDIFRVQDWKNLIDFLDKERTASSRQVYRLDKEAKEIQKEIDWISSELNSMRSKGTWNKLVSIDCEVASEGYLDVDLTYIIQKASWSPEYTIRYLTASDDVEFVYNAKIRQVTGEDWKDVSVVLSTAQPQIGAAPPQLFPFYIMMRSEMSLRAGRAQKAEMELAEKMEADEDIGLATGVQPSPPITPIATEGAAAAGSEFATNLAIKKALDLASGADPRRFMVLTTNLSGEFSRYTAPRVSANVFVKGKFKNALEVPILGGTAEVYIESPAPGGKGKISNFVGREAVPSVLSGEEFDLHLGADQYMKVEHKRVKRERLTKEGAKTTKIRYSYLITLESFKKDSITVDVQDRIPVSNIKEVSIEDVDLEPKPDERREDGILTWKFEMAPGGKREITIEYTIQFPGDWPERRLTLE
jgi:uncharacterized protein (TIGR02231 family)